MSFGMIHDLATTEIAVRRKLQVAVHNIHCGIRLIEDQAPLSDAEHNALLSMLKEAQEAVAEVIGK